MAGRGSGTRPSSKSGAVARRHRPADQPEEKQRPQKAEQACTELMAENLTRARNNFGSSADNMSCIVIYLVPRAAAL